MFTYPYDILAKLIRSSMPMVREVDWYLQQDNTRDKMVMFTSPCVFIEFSIQEGPRNHGNNIQSAVVDVDFHLLTENAKDKGEKIISKAVADPIAHAKLFDLLYKTVQGFSSMLSYLDAFTDLASSSQDQRVMNSLSRINITPPHAVRKTFIKSIQRFRCVMYDHAASKQYTVPEPQPALETISNISQFEGTGIGYMIVADDFVVT